MTSSFQPLTTLPRYIAPIQSRLTIAQVQQLHKNGLTDHLNPYPVAKISLGCKHYQSTWLLISVDPNDTDFAYGLCQHGKGTAYFGHIRFSELEAAAQYASNVHLIVDKDFVPQYPINVYQAAAFVNGIITEDDFILNACCIFKPSVLNHAPAKPIRLLCR
jgi:hypothetical protein